MVLPRASGYDIRCGFRTDARGEPGAAVVLSALRCARSGANAWFTASHAKIWNNGEGCAEGVVSVWIV